MEPSDPNDALIQFSAESPTSLPADALRPWRILVVDDDDDVYESTRLALGDTPILGRPLQLLHANSARAALDLLQKTEDVAVILLDVVMETERAGLDIIAQIREQFGLTRTRIILRTGQPGYAPEIETIQRYDINDYRTKSELTHGKLYAALATALRAYDQLCRIEESRRGLTQIIKTSQQLAAATDKIAFCRMVLQQLGTFLHSAPDGLICNVTEDTPPHQLRLLTGLGRYAGTDGRLLCEVADAAAIELITQCASQGHNVIGENAIASHLGADQQQTLIGLLHYAPHITPDEALLNVFSNNVALNAHIVDLIAELRRTAFIDRLTSLPNRSAMLSALEHRITRQHGCGNCPDDTTPEPAAPCVLALLDIDQFAAINDLFGHAYGDALLAAIACRLREQLGTTCQLARIGHDVFSILGPESIVLPERLQALFLDPFHFDGSEHAVTVSMGLVRIHLSRETGSPQPTDTNTDTNTDTHLRHSEGALLKDAWIALKHAKSQGQSQVAWYSGDLGAITRGHSRLLQSLRGAFNANHLYLVYQPQLDFGTNRVVGVEALLRWRGEDGRLIPPTEFIPVAESSGLIIAVGEWVLRTAMNAFHEIRRAGHPDIRIAVNLSTVQLCHPGFLDMIDGLLSETAFPPHQLELEITESVAIKGAEVVEGLLLALRNRGIAIALDDFGTGFSSLSYLDRLPADRIKIDRSFVEALTSGVRGARIAELVIPLGNTLGMTVLAEGVETEIQAARLRDLGCHEAQGFLYARPVPLPELLLWLDQWKQQQAS